MKTALCCVHRCFGWNVGAFQWCDSPTEHARNHSSRSRDCDNYYNSLRICCFPFDSQLHSHQSSSAHLYPEAQWSGLAVSAMMCNQSELWAGHWAREWFHPRHKAKALLLTCRQTFLIFKNKNKKSTRLRVPVIILGLFLLLYCLYLFKQTLHHSSKCQFMLDQWTRTWRTSLCNTIPFILFPQTFSLTPSASPSLSLISPFIQQSPFEAFLLGLWTFWTFCRNRQ